MLRRLTIPLFCLLVLTVAAGATAQDPVYRDQNEYPVLDEIEAARDAVQAERDSIRAAVEAEWDAVLAVNLRGVFVCTKASVRQMMRQRYGRIVNIASVVGIFGNKGQANYAASKAGIIGFTKAMAKELGSRNITVNAVAPGFIDIGLTGELNEEQRKRLSENIPLVRLGQAEDVARCVAFLASDAAGYITGQVLPVDGGLAM